MKAKLYTTLFITIALYSHIVIGASMTGAEKLLKAPDWVFQQIKSECITWAKQFRSGAEFEQNYIHNCVNLSLDNEGFHGVKSVNWQPKSKRKYITILFKSLYLSMIKVLYI